MRHFLFAVLALLGVAATTLSVAAPAVAGFTTETYNTGGGNG